MNEALELIDSLTLLIDLEEPIGGVCAMPGFLMLRKKHKMKNTKKAHLRFSIRFTG